MTPKLHKLPPDMTQVTSGVIYQAQDLGVQTVTTFILWEQVEKGNMTTVRGITPTTIRTGSMNFNWIQASPSTFEKMMDSKSLKKTLAAYPHIYDLLDDLGRLTKKD